MGFDTECDLTLEPGEDDERAAGIAAFRARRLAEHLGVATERVMEAERAHDSLIGAIESLLTPADAQDDRTLRVLEVVEDASDNLGGVLHLADPEDSVPLDGLAAAGRPRRGKWSSSRAPSG